jgi:dCMP deaminase
MTFLQPWAQKLAEECTDEECSKLLELLGPDAGLAPDVAAQGAFVDFQSLTKWQRRYLGLAAYISSWSKDPSTKTGAVIADRYNEIVSLGINGFPRGVKDAPHLLSHREKKYYRTIHAETNAIMSARGNTRGNTIFVWPMPPCSKCATLIIQSGLSRVISRAPSKDHLSRWEDDINIANEMFAEAGVEVLTVNQEVQHGGTGASA